MKARINEEGDILGIYNEDWLTTNSSLVMDWDLINVSDSEHQKIAEGWTYKNNVWTAPPEPTIQVPLLISKMKLRIQLVLSGVSLASIYDAIAQIPNEIQKEIVYTKWEHAVTFDRNDETLNQMAAMLQISTEQLDEIFIEGNKLS